MIVIESGGSKSSWAFYDKKSSSTKYLETVGLHPLEVDSKKIYLLSEFLKTNNIKAFDSKVYFYGAGCEKQKGKQTIKHLLSEFGFKKVSVETDLKGACLAHYGNKSGIVGILGTGAVVAQFNGKSIVKKTSGLGHLLGDEGSGFDLGKRLLNAYFYERLPANIKYDVEDYFLPETDIIHRINQSDGRKIIAGLTKVMHNHINHKIIQSLIKDAFLSFYETAIATIPNSSKIALTGSIAYYFEKEIINTLKQRNITVTQIHKSAIKPLFQYHLENTN